MFTRKELELHKTIDDELKVFPSKQTRNIIVFVQLKTWLIIGMHIMITMMNIYNKTVWVDYSVQMY